MKVTIKEIAHRAGYSASTVSRLLNDDATLSITSTTRQKILVVAQELGYWKDKPHPKITAQIALLTLINPADHLEDNYFQTLDQAVHEAFSGTGLELTAFHQVDDLLKVAKDYQGFVAIGTDGLNGIDLEILHRAFARGIFIDSNPAPQYFDSIQPNLHLTVRNAYYELKKAGKVPIAFIGGEGPLVNGQRQPDPRAATFAQLAPDSRWQLATGPFNVQNGYQLGKQLLKRFGKQRPQGLIVASDTLSVGVLQAFNEAGVLVPRDLALISINDSDVAKYVSAPLTTYRIDQLAMCDLAVQLIKAALTRQAHRPHIHALVDTELIIRKSFAP